MPSTFESMSLSAPLSSSPDASSSRPRTGVECVRSSTRPAASDGSIAAGVNCTRQTSFLFSFVLTSVSEPVYMKGPNPVSVRLAVYGAVPRSPVLSRVTRPGVKLDAATSRLRRIGPSTAAIVAAGTFAFAAIPA